MSGSITQPGPPRSTLVRVSVAITVTTTVAALLALTATAMTADTQPRTTPGPAGGARVNAVGQLEISDHIGGAPVDVVTVGAMAYVAAGPRIQAYDLEQPVARRWHARSELLPVVLEHLGVTDQTLVALGRTAADDSSGLHEREWQLLTFGLQDGRPVRRDARAVTGQPSALVVRDGWAYVAAGDAGLQLVEVVDGALGRTVSASDRARLLAVADDVVLVTSRGSALLEVIDVSVPTQPRLLASVSLEGLLPFVAHMAVWNDHLYLAPLVGATQVFDISTPATPRALEPLAVDARRFLQAEAGYLFTAGPDDTGTRVLDLATPAVPVETTVIPGAAPAAVAVRGEVVLLAGQELGFAIYDVSRPPLARHRFQAEQVGRVDDIEPSSSRLYAVTTGYPASGAHTVAIDRVAVADGAPDLDQGHLPGDYRPVALGEDRGRVLGLAQSPLRVGVFDLGSGTRLAGVLDGGLTGAFDAAAGYAYVGQHSPTGDRILILELNRTARSVGVGSPSFDAVRLDAMPSALVVDRQRLYVLMQGTSSVLRIYDVSRPMEPEVLGDVAIGGRGRDLVVAGRYALVATHRGLIVLDVAVPQRPRVVSRLAMDAEVVAVAARASRGFVLSDEALYELSLRDPSDPQIRAAVRFPWVTRGRLALGAEHVFLAAGPAGLFTVPLDEIMPEVAPLYLPSARVAR